MTRLRSYRISVQNAAGTYVLGVYPGTSSMDAVERMADGARLCASLAEQTEEGGILLADLVVERITHEGLVSRMRRLAEGCRCTSCVYVRERSRGATHCEATLAARTETL